MRFSKRSLEGWLLIDNRHAPVDPVWARASGKAPVGAGGAVTELATLTCSHCQRQLIVQPLRTRERAYCRRCDRYLCDDCALVARLSGGACAPMSAVLDRQQEQALKLLKG